jgi:hypothetical protein
MLLCSHSHGTDFGSVVVGKIIKRSRGRISCLGLDLQNRYACTSMLYITRKVIRVQSDDVQGDVSLCDDVVLGWRSDRRVQQRYRHNVFHGSDR